MRACMPRPSSHFSNGGTTTTRFERRGREMMPMVWKDCPEYMCVRDSTPGLFCARGENTPDCLRLPEGGSGGLRGNPDQEIQRIRARIEPPDREAFDLPRFRRGRSLGGAVRIGA